MKRRIFVAIPIPENIKAEAEIWQRQHPDFGVRWIRSENLHITVVPPWYISETSPQNAGTIPPEGRLYQIEKTLQQAVSGFKPFMVCLQKILWGPPRPEVHLIWAEGETPKEFIDLKDKVELALLNNAETEFSKRENRPPKLHLTIARFEPTAIKKLPRLDEAVDWRFEVGEIQLMESVLKREGADYKILKHLIFKFNF